MEVLLEYVAGGLAVVDGHLLARAKPTSRMYEQWVYIQLCQALIDLGFRCKNQTGLFQLTRRTENRYTLDLQRDARLDFIGADGSLLTLRYEPWLHPKSIAQSSGDNLYRGSSGVASWSPDVLLELRESGERTAGASHVVVIDAKYTRTPERSWETVAKYLEIRSIDTDEQVAKQVWIAWPSEKPGDEFRFPEIGQSWERGFGPIARQAEFLRGAVSLTPELEATTGSAGTASREFLAGILRFYGWQALA